MTSASKIPRPVKTTFSQRIGNTADETAAHRSQKVAAPRSKWTLLSYSVGGALVLLVLAVLLDVGELVHPWMSVIAQRLQDALSMHVVYTCIGFLCVLGISFLMCEEPSRLDAFFHRDAADLDLARESIFHLD